MSLPVGLSTSQGVSNGSTPLQPSDKYNIGIMWERQRGIPNVPITVNTLQEDRKIFGGVVSGQVGALISRNIFKNSGSYGASITGIRMLGASSVVASQLVNDAAAGTASLAVVTLITHASGVAEVKQCSPLNNALTTSYSVVIAETGATGTPWTFVYAALNAAPGDVVNGLVALMLASTSFMNAFDVQANGDSFKLTSVAKNVAFTVTPTITQASATPVTLGTVKAAQQGQDDPGTWANGAVSTTLYPYGVGYPGRFALNIALNGVTVESYTSATIAGLYAQMNANSFYLRIDTSGGTAGAWVTTTQTFTLSGGTYVAPTGESAYYPTYDGSGNPVGMSLFDSMSIQMYAVPDYQTSTMAAQGQLYCSGRGAGIFVTCLPQFANSAAVKAFSQVLQTADIIGSYVSATNAWVRTSDESGGNVWVPAVGCILGAGYLRVPKMNADKIWTPPAGTDSVFVDCDMVSPNNLSQATINLYVQTYTTNVVVLQNGTGNYLISSRTMSTNSLFESIHVRRLTDWILGTLQNSYQWVSQKPNTPELKKSIIVGLLQYFRGLYNDGALERSVPFETAVSVISDITNNPRTQDRKELNVDIEWIPVECVEAVAMNLNRNDGVLITTVTNN